MDWILPQEDSHRTDDVLRLVGAVAMQGYSVSPTEMLAAWYGHSDGVAASWLSLPDSINDLMREARYALETYRATRKPE